MLICSWTRGSHLLWHLLILMEVMHEATAHAENKAFNFNFQDFADTILEIKWELHFITSYSKIPQKYSRTHFFLLLLLVSCQFSKEFSYSHFQDPVCLWPMLISALFSLHFPNIALPHLPSSISQLCCCVLMSISHPCPLESLLPPHCFL